MKRWCVAGAATIAVFLLIASFVPAPHLVLSRFDSGETLYIYPAAEGFVFSVEFIHSVNQSPVAEIFQIRGGEIFLYALEFVDFGAGMPTEQEIIRLPCGTMRIEFDRDATQPNYIVGREAELVLYIGQTRVPLNSLAEAGTVIEFTYRRLNFWRR